MRRFTAILAVLLIAAVALVGCGGGNKAADSNAPAAGDSSKALKVAVVVKALNSDYWHIVEAGAKAAGAELGVEVTVLGPNAESDVTGQISMIEDQINKGISALVVAPSQPAAAIPAFEQAKAKGIPVVLIDTDADWADKTSFLGTGNRNAGKLAGEYLAGKLGQGAKVAIVRGQMGDPTHDAREQGATEALTAAGLEVVTVQPADSDTNKALAVTENILQANPEIKGIYATSDDMALGVARAVEQLQKKGQILVMGFDGSPNGLKAVKEGSFVGTVAQQPYQMGYQGVQTAVKAARGEPVEKAIDTGAEVIDAANVDAAEQRLNEILGK